MNTFCIHCGQINQGKMLKQLFTSNTRVKLLTVFLMNPGEEYFIRELTRKLDEQINSVRRELDNLKKLGFLRTRTKNHKKYYYVNKNFIILEELRSIIIKANSSHEGLANDIRKMGDVKLLALSGVFVEKDTQTVDMLIVGDVNKEKLSDYINNKIRTPRPVKFTIMSENDYRYRQDCKDKFIREIINNSSNRFPIKKI